MKAGSVCAMLPDKAAAQSLRRPLGWQQNGGEARKTYYKNHVWSEVQFKVQLEWLDVQFLPCNPGRQLEGVLVGAAVMSRANKGDIAPDEGVRELLRARVIPTASIHEHT